MNSFALRCYAFSISAAAALLAGCGGSQPPIGAPGVENHTSLTPHANSFRVLYRFAGGNDGAYPTTNLIDVNGTLYGTTNQGGGYGCSGIGCGTVYSISTNGVESVLHRFGSRADGAIPAARLQELNGKLYGTTIVGGEFGDGTVYSITTTGKEKVLHSFESGYADGSEPVANLIEANGMLYGTTYSGGGTSGSRSGYGTVYSISTRGVEMVVHRFDQAPDGRLPEAGLANLHRVMYGTTAQGGAYGTSGKGTVFSVTTTGAEKVLYRFQGSPDAEEPQASLVDVGGTLYGTTLSGGTAAQECAEGCGTVFGVTKAGVETVLHSFGTTYDDGRYPEASFAKVDDRLYGTTSEGGTASQPCGNGCGTIFSITKTGAEKILYEFTGGATGWYPLSGLLKVNGTLYGTAAYGGSGCGSNGCGIVFAWSL
jgi:uncharacterized repeat protein (TIGR03803 family)